MISAIVLVLTIISIYVLQRSEETESVLAYDLLIFSMASLTLSVAFLMRVLSTKDVERHVFNNQVKIYRFGQIFVYAGVILLVLSLVLMYDPWDNSPIVGPVFSWLTDGYRGLMPSWVAIIIITAIAFIISAFVSWELKNHFEKIRSALKHCLTKHGKT